MFSREGQRPATRHRQHAGVVAHRVDEADYANELVAVVEDAAAGVAWKYPKVITCRQLVAHIRVASYIAMAVLIKPVARVADDVDGLALLRLALAHPVVERVIHNQNDVIVAVQHHFRDRDALHVDRQGVGPLETMGRAQ